MPRRLSHPTVISGRLRIVFERRDDRWGHRVEWRAEDGGFVPLLESLEGSPREDVVPSPAMQDLTMQETPDGGEVALGVGMTGRNHWSIAFTQSEENWLAFGLACRMREALPGLRSSYRLVPSMQITRLESRAIELAGPNVGLCVHSEETLTRIDGGIAIVVETDPSQQLPYTRKWSYAIGGKPAAEL